MSIEFYFYILLASAITATEDTGEIITKDVIGWMVDLLAIVIAAIALIYTAKQIKYEGNAKYAETFKTIEEDLTTIENNPGRSSADSIVRSNWEIGLLNNLERLAWLIKAGKYPKEFEGYYRIPFSGALYLLETSQKTKQKEFSGIMEICPKKGWTSNKIY